MYVDYANSPNENKKKTPAPVVTNTNPKPVIPPADTVPTFTPPPLTDYKSPYADDMQKYMDDYDEWAQQPYASPYADQIKGLVSNILGRHFNYNPANDAQFQLAAKELTRNVMESMNSRGILNSTVTENQTQQGIADMMPQYRQIAYNQFLDEGNLLNSQVNMLMGLDEQGYNRYKDQGEKAAQALNLVMNMDETQYTRWKDAYQAKYTEAKDKYDAAIQQIEQKRKRIQDEYDRINNLNNGVVDNQASIVLGVKPGALTKEARAAKEKRQQELADQAAAYKHAFEMADLTYKNNVKLENLRTANDLKVANARAANATPASTKNLPVEQQGNKEQVNNYYALRDIYLGGSGGKYKDNPKAAYDNLMAKAKDNIVLVGDKLYNRLLADVTSAMDVNKKYGTVNSSTSYTIDDWGKKLDAEFIPKYDSSGSVTFPGVTDSEEREKRILDLNLPDDMTIQLYKRYGIPLPQ